MSDQVVVVIGVGGMGQAIARRQGAGKSLLVADFDAETLDRVAAELTSDGFEVTTARVDVSKHSDVAALAATAAGLGRVEQVAHTAGLSPNQASTEAILGVDLFGVAYVLEEFGKVIEQGGAGVVISSMSGHLAPPFQPAQQNALATASAADLPSLPFLRDLDWSPQVAYGSAKHANHLRVQGASKQWGERGARVNSISPGVISTPMGQLELNSGHGDVMRTMIEASGTKRLGTPADIAAAAAFLFGSDSSFLTGTDLLVDGGVVAALRSGFMQLPTA